LGEHPTIESATPPQNRVSCEGRPGQARTGEDLVIEQTGSQIDHIRIRGSHAQERSPIGKPQIVGVRACHLAGNHSALARATSEIQRDRAQRRVGGCDIVVRDRRAGSDCGS
jgi:hypothetical protein